MKRILAIWILMLCCAGCHAPVPKVNPFTYGKTCVPPPGTNTFSAPNSYYTVPPAQVPVTPSTGTGFRQMPANNRWSNQETPQGDAVAANVNSVGLGAANSTVNVVAPQDVDVALARTGVSNSATPAAFLTDSSTAVRIIPSTAAVANTTPQVRGMVVNDLTRLAEPPPFTPASNAIEISQLPNPPVSAAGSVTTPSNVSASTPQSSSTVTKLDGGWRTR